MFIKWLIALFKLEQLMIQETPRPDREDPPRAGAGKGASIPNGKIVQLRERSSKRKAKPAQAE